MAPLFGKCGFGVVAFFCFGTVGLIEFLSIYARTFYDSDSRFDGGLRCFEKKIAIYPWIRVGLEKRCFSNGRVTNRYADLFDVCLSRG